VVRPTGRWENNINMSLKEIWCHSVNWIHLAKDRLWCQVLRGSIKSVNFLTSGGNMYIKKY
jgi:hypothetical protein